MVVRAASARVIAVVVAAASAALYITLGWQQWSTYWVPSWDLGIFSQLAKAYAHGQAPIVDIKGEGFNLLGDHFHPILVLLGPVWRLWPSPMSLLAAQGVLFGVSAYPITRYAVTRLSAGLGFVAGLSYALSWGLQSAALSQFHEIAFAVPMLAFGLIAFLEGRLVSSVVWISLLVFVKEDLGLTVALFGVVLWVTHRDRLRLGQFAVFWGLGRLIFSTVVFLPLLNPKNQYDYTDRIGVGASLLSLDTYAGLLMLLATMAAVGARSRIAWLMLPTLAWRLIGNVQFYWGWEWHYSAVLMPMAFAALFDKMPDPKWLRRWALSLTVAATLAVGPKMPLWRLGEDSYWGKGRAAGVQEVLESVPNGASVATDLVLLSALVPEHKVFWIGTSHSAPDYLVASTWSSAWPQEARMDFAVWASARYQSPYTMVWQDATWAVIKRG